MDPTDGIFSGRAFVPGQTEESQGKNGNMGKSRKLRENGDIPLMGFAQGVFLFQGKLRNSQIGNLDPMGS